MRGQMKHPDELKALYCLHPNHSQLVDALADKEVQRIRLEGLAGSAAAFIAAAIPCDRPHLFVLPERESALYFLNDLENLVGEKNVLFFPASYKKKYNTETIDNPSVLLRAEVLNSFRESERNAAGMIVVTWPEALFEKVVTKQNLVQNTMEIHAGEKLSMDFVTAFLDSYDFERTDFVAEPGQYAVRGGIIDVFSFAHEIPCRFEFSGEKVSSVRSFHPVSQLSVAELNEAVIIPNIQTYLVKENRESFFAFIPQHTAVWINNARQLFASAVPENLLFEQPQDVQLHMDKFTVLETGSRSYYTPSLTLRYSTELQPSFNKNFKLLRTHLEDNAAKGIHNIIFAGTARQSERLYAIFEDLAAASHAQQIPFTTRVLQVHEGFIDNDLKTACYTDHQIFGRYHRFRLRQRYTKNEMMTLKEITALRPGDFITHIDHGIGKFAGLEKIEVNGKPQEAIRLVYRDNDILYVSIHSLHRITKYSGKDGTTPSLHKLGSSAWSTLKQKTKKKVKDIAKDLIALYAKRRMQKGFAFSPDSYLQHELEASFIYEDTPDQLKATRDVKKDMEKPYPMDRLICGDVGFGKTEVAMRAAFKAVADGRQAAVLVPTTILALQHYETFRERLRDFPCRVEYINRFRSASKQNEILRETAAGRVDILIGTHRLLGKDVKFKDLGLLVIDEEQKFGVAAKEKLKALKLNVDTLTLTATPIPRTLQFSLMGARDLSIINTPPLNRYPVLTELHPFNEDIIAEAVRYEMERGGQVFFVHNRIQDIHEVAALLERLCPGARIAAGHGQMDGRQLEDTMLGFITGDYDILVSTSIIESGLDIPNVNTIIINQAQNFGLSDLHQLRGRVGRSNKKAFCYLLAPPAELLTPEAKQRLKAIEDFSDLGSGFNISMRDLDIRGAGNMLGGEQSGFIAEIGFEMYHKILDEAVQELKETEFREIFSSPGGDPGENTPREFVKECQIDTDLEVLIPDYYVGNITERLHLYKELDSLEEEQALLQFVDRLTDRFGTPPTPVTELVNAVGLRRSARKLGFEKVVLKKNKMVAYFISDPASEFYKSDLFGAILGFVQNEFKGMGLKEEKGKLMLVFENVSGIQPAAALLGRISSSALPRQEPYGMLSKQE